jgi:hypothetical protein
MTQQSTPTPPTIRHDGWTQPRRAQFLEALSHNGNVLAACARVGMSREAAYRLRRREPAFARAWAAAQMVGREASAEVLGCRAIDGVEEDVWHRGEFKGTRRRFDSRLLLAHMARLDKLAEANEGAVADAERFDELVALACGAEAPEELAHDGVLPLVREECMEQAGTAADLAVDVEWEDGRAEREADGELDEEALKELGREMQDRGVQAYREARTQAGECWDRWVGQACETVDRLLAEPLVPVATPAAGPETPGTPSELSTSPAAPTDAPASQRDRAAASTLSGVSTSALATALVGQGTRA